MIYNDSRRLILVACCRVIRMLLQRIYLSNVISAVISLLEIIFYHSTYTVVGHGVCALYGSVAVSYFFSVSYGGRLILQSYLHCILCVKDAGSDAPVVVYIVVSANVHLVGKYILVAA